MKKLIRPAVRLMVLAALAACLLMIGATADRGGSPYISSLADLAITNAYAAKPGGCNNSVCQHIFPTTKWSCRTGYPLQNCKLSGGGNNCTTSGC